MRILQLTKKFPYPLKDGESIAVTNLSKSLHALGCEITLLSMNTIKHYIDPSTIPTSFDHYKKIHTVDLDNRVTVWGAFKNLFSKESYHVSRFYYQKYKEKLVELLRGEQYDVVQLETLYLAPYIDSIRQYSNATIVMRSHNVEFEIWNRIASNTGFLPKKIYLKYLAKKLENFELNNLKHYDALVTVTQRDLDAYKKLGFRAKGIALPIGINCKEYFPGDISNLPQSISFIGSLDWIPNLEGLNWFLEKVWPEVKQNNADLKLHIAGRNTPQEIRNLADSSIVVEGEVDNAHSFLNSHLITIVPLLSGSGMRVKILEGMALARVVVSTSVGMEGIHAKNKEEILCADSPKDFAAVLNWILKDIEVQHKISSNARDFIADHFDVDTNAKRFLHFLQEIC
ncbi:MAG: glycosyltransferase family 4 protein [Bacteroidota bacterium]